MKMRVRRRVMKWRRWWRGGGLKGMAASCVVGEGTEECDGGGGWVVGRRNATWVEEV